MIVVIRSPPLSRFCERNGLPENTLALPFTRRFAPKGILARQPRCGSRVTSLRKESGPPRRPRRYYPLIGGSHLLDLLGQAHPQVKVAWELAQAFAQMIRGRNATALEAWQQETTTSGVPELRPFAAGSKRDQAAVLAALTYEWSQGQVEGQIHRLKLLKRQSSGRAGFDLLRHRVLARSA